MVVDRSSVCARNMVLVGGVQAPWHTGRGGLLEIAHPLCAQHDAPIAGEAHPVQPVVVDLSGDREAAAARLQAAPVRGVAHLDRLGSEGQRLWEFGLIPVSSAAPTIRNASLSGVVPPSKKPGAGKNVCGIAVRKPLH